MYTSLKSNRAFFYVAVLLSLSLGLAEGVRAQPGDLRTPAQIEKDLKEKLNQANESLNKDPMNVDYYIYRAQVYVECNRQSEILSRSPDKKKQFEELLKNPDEKFEILIINPDLKAVYLMKASADFERAVELAPNSSYVYAKRAEFRQRTPDWLKDSDAAISDYLEAIRLSKKDFRRQSPNLSEDDSRYAHYFLEMSYIYFNRAQTLSKKPEMLTSYVIKPGAVSEFRLQHPQYSLWNDFDTAIEYARIAVTNADIAPGNEPSLVVNYFMTKGVAAYQLREYKMALDAYNSAEAYWNEKFDAVCKTRPFCKDEKQDFRQSLARARAEIYVKLKEPQKALDDINFFISNDKRNKCAQTFRLRAIIYWQLGKDELAEANDKEAEELPDCR